MKKRATGLLLALLMTVCGAQGALGAGYSFPHAGVRLDAPAEWTVLTPDTLDSHAELMAQMGADLELVRADYAVNNTVFEVYMPGGIQVSFSAVQTEQTAAWGSTAHMSESDLELFLAAYQMPFYAHVGWSDLLPGYLACDWTVEAGGIPVSFAGLMTVRQGMLYTFTATGSSVELEELHVANGTVLASLVYLGSSIESAGEAPVAGPALPVPIVDDGKVTPLAVDEAFTGITYEDTTELYLHTLPGTDLMLQTATDQLRGRADADGVHRYRLSTRRETQYAYTITAQAEGREATVIELTVDRRLTPEAEEAAYRRTAMPIETYGYGNLSAAPESFGGKPVTFRGRVDSFTEMGGYPCALVYTENPSRGAWQNPMWVLLTEAVTLGVDDIRTFYGELRGDTLSYTDESGQTRHAPVVISRIVSE